MPKPDKAARREAQQRKARHGMRMSGRTTKTLMPSLPRLKRRKPLRNA